MKENWIIYYLNVIVNIKSKIYDKMRKNSSGMCIDESVDFILGRNDYVLLNQSYNYMFF